MYSHPNMLALCSLLCFHNVRTFAQHTRSKGGKTSKKLDSKSRRQKRRPKLGMPASPYVGKNNSFQNKCLLVFPLLWPSIDHRLHVLPNLHKLLCMDSWWMKLVLLKAFLKDLEVHKKQPKVKKRKIGPLKIHLFITVLILKRIPFRPFIPTSLMFSFMLIFCYLQWDFYTWELSLKAKVCFLTRGKGRKYATLEIFSGGAQGEWSMPYLKVKMMLNHLYTVS